MVDNDLCGCLFFFFVNRLLKAFPLGFPSLQDNKEGFRTWTGSGLRAFFVVAVEGKKEGYDKGGLYRTERVL